MDGAGSMGMNWRRSGLIVAATPVIVWWLERVILLPSAGWFNPGSAFAIGGDLRTFHTAAYLVTHGRAELVYQSPAFEQVFAVEGGGYGPFANTPALLPLIAPLGWLSFEAAWVVLAIVSILGIVLGLHLLGIRRVWSGAAIAMLFPPVYFALTFGQVSVLWFVIFAATYRLLWLRRPIEAGLVAGLLVMKPTLAVGLVLWWAVDRRRSHAFAVAAVASATLALGISFVLFANAWTSYGDSVAALLADPGHPFRQWAQFSIWSSWRLLFPSSEGLAVVAGIVAVSLCLALLLPTLRRGRDPRVAFSSAVLLTTLASPYLLAYDWVLLLIPVALLGTSAGRNRERVVSGAIVVTIAAGWSTVIVNMMLDRFGLAIQIAPLVLAAVAWMGREMLAGRQRLT